MASFVKAVFKATIGALVNKARGLAAEKLKEGDVADEKFRQLIVREMDDIMSKLDGISGKDLAASISFFNDGIVCLGQALDGDGEQKNAVTAPKADGAIKGTTKEEKTFLLTKGIKNLQLTGLNEDATEAISRAKKRFEDARREAVKAFGITTLSTSDRLLAMKIRIMATILEQVDSPANALASCRLCLEELHSLPAVQENFSVALKKEGIKSMIGKDQRREIIAAVCQMNRIIYDVTQMVLEDGESKAKELLIWPCVNVGKERIDPLRDSRIARKLRKVGMEQCCVQVWSFGQEGKARKHRLESAVSGIAINTKQQFIVSGNYRDVKVFDSSGKFLYQFSPPDIRKKGRIQDVAIDQDDNMYVLVNDREQERGYMHVFDTQANLHHSFLLRPGYDVFSVVVDDSNKILISVTESRRPEVSEDMYYQHHDGHRKNTKEMMVEVYENRGKLLHRMEVMCQDPQACLVTVGDAGRVMVLDGTSCTLHLFGAQKNYPLEKKVQLTGCYLPTAITFHKASEHLFVASSCENGVLRVSLHNKDGEYVRSIPLEIVHPPTRNTSVITMTNNGRIVVGLEDSVFVA